MPQSIPLSSKRAAGGKAVSHSKGAKPMDNHNRRAGLYVATENEKGCALSAQPFCFDGGQRMMRTGKAVLTVLLPRPVEQLLGGGEGFRVDEGKVDVHVALLEEAVYGGDGHAQRLFLRVAVYPA